MLKFLSILIEENIDNTPNVYLCNILPTTKAITFYILQLKVLLGVDLVNSKAVMKIILTCSKWFN